MLIQLKRLVKRGHKLILKDWRVLSFLMFGAFLLGCFGAFLNAGGISLYLSQKGLLEIGFNFIVIGGLLSLVGRWTVKLDRRLGYGGVPLCGLLFFSLLGLLFFIDKNTRLGANLLFLYLYTAPLLLQVAFWMIAHRFIPLRLDSYKFLGVLVCECLGFVFSGWQMMSMSQVGTALWWGLWVLAGLFCVMKFLVWLLPVANETFVKKTGGVQDAPEFKLVFCILGISFLYTLSGAWADYLFYSSLSSENSFFVFAKIWFAKGILGVLLTLLLFKISYIYIMIGGILSLSLGLYLIGSFYLINSFSALCVVFTMIQTLSFLYWGRFLQMLPRLLVLGEGVRIRWRRDVIWIPLAWVLSGAVILNFSKTSVAVFLIISSEIFLMGEMMALMLYNRFFIQMCQTFRWLNGPLMLLSNKAKSLLHRGCQSENLDEVLYFFRLMEQTRDRHFESELVRGLSHPLEGVRLFCVDKLDKCGLSPFLYRQFSKLLKTESSDKVRCQILAALIHREGEENSTHVFHQFGAYLDDEKLKAGAILGFLQSGGECALLAMDGLQQLTQSSKVEEIMQGLDIIDHVPQTGLIRLVLPLLKHPNSKVVERAILTAGHIGHTQSLSFVLSALDMPEFQESALRALKNYGKLALPAIEKMIGNVYVPLPRRKKLVAFLGYLPSGEGKQILLRQLQTTDLKLRKDILQAILDSKIVWVRRQRMKILIPSLMKDMEEWYWLKQNIQKCRQAPETTLAESFGFLGRSFEQMTQDLKVILLNQIMLLYPNELVFRAVQMIFNPVVAIQLNGIEILQDLIGNKIYQQLRPILMDSYNGQIIQNETALNKSEAHHFLKQLILKPDFTLDRWTQAAVLYGLKQVGSKTDLDILKRAFQSSWSLVWEAALDAVNYWLDEKEKKEFLTEVLDENPQLELNRYLIKQEEK